MEIKNTVIIILCIIIMSFAHSRRINYRMSGKIEILRATFGCYLIPARRICVGGGSTGGSGYLKVQRGLTSKLTAVPRPYGTYLPFTIVLAPFARDHRTYYTSYIIILLRRRDPLLFSPQSRLDQPVVYLPDKYT